jgi:hypothetical protein
MSPYPDESSVNSEDTSYFSDAWENLPWTPWIPFTATKAGFRAIPRAPGLYRIRPSGKKFLMFIGQTKRTLHQRLNELRHTLRRGELMPWNDPLTEAPALWAWQDAEGFSYECSAALLDVSQSNRQGMQSFLLYRYRQDYGESPLCNFGRFHPRYRKSTDRKENKRGGKLEGDHLDNPAGGPGLPPLTVTGAPGDRDWMGLAWSGRRPFDGETITTMPQGAGLYLLFERDTGDLIYIGQSADCAQRLWSHAMKLLEEKDMLVSYYIEEKPVLPHNLKERENDLVGNYFEMYWEMPDYPFGKFR